MTIGFRPRRGRNVTLNLIFFFEKRVVRVIKINFFFELGHPNMIKPHIGCNQPPESRGMIIINILIYVTICLNSGIPYVPKP